MLWQKVGPLYILIFLGFIAGKLLHVSRESFAKTLIYIVGPTVVLSAVWKTPLQIEVVTFPVVTFVICVFFSFVSLFVGRQFLNRQDAHTLAFGLGSGNTGYFGLPVALSLFGEASAGQYLMGVLGFILFENTLGFMIAARGHHSWREAIIRVLKIPTLYAFITGVSLQVAGIAMPSSIHDIFAQFRGAYTVMGMMMVGIALSQVQLNRFQWKAMFFALGYKHIVWPLLTLLLIFPLLLAGLITPQIAQYLALLAVVPLPANMVAVAAEFKLSAELAALLVFFSTCLGAISVPLGYTWIYSHIPH